VKLNFQVMDEQKACRYEQELWTYWIWGRQQVATYRLFATRMSQLKMCDFSGQTFKGFEVL
jgi:hypothetical protein